MSSVSDRAKDPTYNWDLPDVAMPDDPYGACPVLTAEQWVVWFRTQTTMVQVAAAKSILELQNDAQVHFTMDTEGRLGRAEDTVESLRSVLTDIKVSLRSILESTKDVKPQKKRAAMLVERVTAIGVAIKEMGL